MYTFLPPANEVAGKVMFLHLSVILFTEGSLSTGGLCPQGGLCTGGVSVQERVGCMHPSGMHSCSIVISNQSISYLKHIIVNGQLLVEITTSSALCRHENYMQTWLLVTKT